MKKLLIIGLIGSLFVSPQGYTQSIILMQDSLLVIQKGTASYYGRKFHKKKTASGEVFNMNKFTAAHKHLPFGTMLKVRNQENGYEVIVEVNDRLPQNSQRIIDLSRKAADQIEMVQEGLVPVELHVLSFATVEELREHYEEIPSELRLRVFYESVDRPEDPALSSLLPIEE
jgi:rare lipoprotein A